MTCPVIEGVTGRIAVLVDWSGLVHAAFHSEGINGMLGKLAYRLSDLMKEPRPAAVALALDPPDLAWRHELTKHLDPDKRYKAKRPPKPDGFRVQADLALDLAAAYGIPLWWASGYEADDIAATVVPQLRAGGYAVALLTQDKDWGQLVTYDGGPPVVLWDGYERVRGPFELEAEFKIPCSRLGDYLAIDGDKADNVPGVNGLGGVAAAAVVRRWASLGDVFAAPEGRPRSTVEAEINELVKTRTKVQKKSKGLVPGTAEASELDEQLASATRRIEALRLERDLETYRAAIVAVRGDVSLSRELVSLDASAPVTVDLDLVPVGDFDVMTLRRLFEDAGKRGLAQQVMPLAKRKRGRHA